MSVRVGRKGYGAVYIGRPSVLGNPFVMTSEAQRTEVIAKYKVYFDKKVAVRDPKFMEVLDALVEHSRAGMDLVLGCFCAPRACHGDVIKEYIDRKVAESKE